jgi:hypothetical protein
MAKDTKDNKTFDVLGASRPVGRPAKVVAIDALDKKRIQREQAAARQAKRRAALKETHGMLTVSLPLDVLEGFRKYLQFKDLTQDQVIEKLIRTQLLRPR